MKNPYKSNEFIVIHNTSSIEKYSISSDPKMKVLININQQSYTSFEGLSSLLFGIQYIIHYLLENIIFYHSLLIISIHRVAFFLPKILKNCFCKYVIN